MNKLLKNEILCYLENQTAFFDLNHMNEVFTAQRLAEHFGVKKKHSQSLFEPVERGETTSQNQFSSSGLFPQRSF